MFDIIYVMFLTYCCLKFVLYQHVSYIHDKYKHNNNNKVCTEVLSFFHRRVLIMMLIQYPRPKKN